MAMSSFRELFLHKLKDLYDAEHQIVEALPKMAEAAQSTDLEHAFREHMQESTQHARRLEEVFQQLGEEPKRVKCDGMKGLIDEGEKVIRESDDAVRDAALIAAAQAVEHYEMAGYGTVRTYAQMLGQQQIADTLQQILNEESRTNEKLTDLSEKINPEAMQQK